jgi:hypothetical protein
MRRDFLVLGITLVMILICAIRMLHSDIEPRYDQRFIQYQFDLRQYPQFSDGIVSLIIVGLYNRLWSLEPAVLNAHIRILAMSLYMLAGYLLLTVRPNRPGLSLLFILLLLTSGFPFLWLSSELFVGAFLMLTVWSIMRRLPFPVFAFFLTCFALTKPDLIFTGILIGLYVVHKNTFPSESKWLQTAILATSVSILVLPAIIQHGLNTNRMQNSFEQHYAALVVRHQIIQPTPDPWTETEKFIQPIWGQHTSLLSMVRSDPARYFDFLLLSLGQTSRNIMLPNILLLLPIWALSFKHSNHKMAKDLSLLILCGFIPITLFSFGHVRYFARFYPILLFLPYLFLAEAPIQRRRIYPWLMGTLVVQSVLFSFVFWLGEWFPD